MRSRIRALFGAAESGQAMILVAVLAAALMGTVGVAIEGGRMLVENRRMQNAADMAALVGAQSAGCESTDSTCINLAKQAACNYAQSNGYGGGWNGSTGCTASGGVTVTVDIPPATCSPYNLDYGSGKMPTACSGTGATQYNYVEVEISNNLGTIPIFNVSVTPYVHAVARRGTRSPRDYAIAVLDPTLAKALTLSGSGSSGCGVCVVGSIISDSSASTSINTGGTSPDNSCGGGWDTASSSETTAPSNLHSYTTGGALFSPPGCTGTQDGTVSWSPGQTRIPDPYGSVNPPPTSGTWANCSECGSSGHYYHWDCRNARSTSGTWDDNGAGNPKAANNNDCYEMFPGQYPGGITATAGNIYLNPGVYNLGTGGLKISSTANICVFGAPICDEFSGNIPGYSVTCGSASMDSSKSSYVPPGTWYYYCSSWGSYDTNPPNGTNGAATGLPTTVSSSPKFTNNTTPTTTPLNGVTFYTYSGGTYQTGGAVKITGSGVESLAFPDPCPGTGTATGTSVPFQSTIGVGDSGASSAQYSYPATSVAYSSITKSVAGSTYPSADLTVNGESTCRALLNSGSTSGSIPDVWPGEFQPTTTGQLLQFLFFMRDKTASIALSGSGTQLFWGIVYNPGDYATAGGCGSSTSGCQISLAGSSGGSGDLPMILGQIIGDGVSIGGSSTIEVFYRPCNDRTQACQLGPGSTLVQ